MRNFTNYPSSIGISNNPKLSHCSIESFCNSLYFTDVYFWANGEGCNSVQEVMDSCEVKPTTCIIDQFTPYNQGAIDNFPIIYSYCTEILGDVVISGYSISNLDGLNQIERIGGTLSIRDNRELNNLDGLSNLASIGGSLTFAENDSLIDLTGLENLSTITHNLEIDSNNLLNNVLSLDSLDYVGGELIINNNDSLQSLAGLQSVNSLNLKGLTITNNPVLSICHTPSICAYLKTYGYIAEVSENSEGCNTTDEIEDHCINTINESGSFDIHVYPNPIDKELIIECSTPFKAGKYSLIDASGKIAISGSLGKGMVSKVDTERLDPGFYIIQIVSEKVSYSIKVLKN